VNTQDYVDAANSITNEMKLEVEGVLEAAGELRKQLITLEELLNDQAYARASVLGYEEISLAFVDLQRCLGGVQALYMDEYMLVQEVARERQCSPEEADLFLASQRQVIEQGDQ
jgi:hypothetical protein